jgi:hypothetical protein
VPGWFPGADFKGKANEWREIAQATPIVPMQHVKDQMVGRLFHHYEPAIFIFPGERYQFPINRFAIFGATGGKQ